MGKSLSQFVQAAVSFFLAGFFVTLFIPLKLRLSEPGIFWGGDFNPYTTSYLYLSDVFFAAACFFVAAKYVFSSQGDTLITVHEENVSDHRNEWPYILFFSLLILLVLLSSLLAPYSTGQTFYFSLRWLQILLLFLFISRGYLAVDLLIRIFVWAMVAQSILAGLQYLTGASLGLTFLGELILRVGEAGVATLNLFGEKFLRGYGTFLHPNIFAAYCFFGIFLALLFRKTRPIFFTVAIIILTFGIFFSFSRTAIFALLILSISYFVFFQRVFVQKIFLVTGAVFTSLLIFFSGLGVALFQRFRFEDIETLRFRMTNLVDSFYLLLRYPFGAGLGNSTELMSIVSGIKYLPWQYQPPHNLFLVVATELGIFGLFLFLAGAFFLFRAIYRRRKIYPLHVTVGVGFLLLSLTDHYFFTLYHGQVLFILFLLFLRFPIPAEPESSPSSH